MREIIKEAIESDRKNKGRLCREEYLSKIEEIAGVIANAFKNKGKVLVFGNGGSAADAEHMACELVGRFQKERKALPAISLTTNTASLTAISNDYSYDVCFARQLEGLANENDVAIGISTSGNAANVIEAIKSANDMNITSIALTGRGGGRIVGIANISLIVPSDDTPRIQEAHILIIHILCELVEGGLN